MMTAKRSVVPGIEEYTVEESTPPKFSEYSLVKRLPYSSPAMRYPGLSEKIPLIFKAGENSNMVIELVIVF